MEREEEGEASCVDVCSFLFQRVFTYPLICFIILLGFISDLFAILKTTEKLERAYVRDAIGAKQYETACRKLLAQFRTLCTTLKGAVRFPSSALPTGPDSSQTLLY